MLLFLVYAIDIDFTTNNNSIICYFCIIVVPVLVSLDCGIFGEDITGCNSRRMMMMIHSWFHIISIDNIILLVLTTYFSLYSTSYKDCATGDIDILPFNNCDDLNF